MLILTYNISWWLSRYSFVLEAPAIEIIPGVFLFEINIPNYYTTSKRIYDTSILLCTSDQRNNSHEASSCWLGCIARKEEETPLEAHGYGRSRNWTSSRPSGIRQIKKVLLSPFSCERFLQVIPQGSYYWRLMWNPPHILLSSGKRKGLKYLSFE